MLEAMWLVGHAAPPHTAQRPHTGAAMPGCCGAPPANSPLPGMHRGPDRIVEDLRLALRLTARPAAAFTATTQNGRPGGLLVERDEGPATATSFRQLTGSDAEFEGWRRFYGRLATLAEDLAPTLTEP